MYTSKNYASKKELKFDVQERNRLLQAPQLGPDDKLYLELLTYNLTPYQPGLGSVPHNGTGSVEGPHFPKPHRWYASVQIKDGVIVKAS